MVGFYTLFDRFQASRHFLFFGAGLAVRKRMAR
jgi:hypothetical protein